MATPRLSLADLFAALHHDVAGSHVQAANLQNFGEATVIQLGELVTRRPR